MGGMETSRILGLGESGEAATRLFRTFTDGKPDLIPTGLGPVDRKIGGLFPGSGGILAAATGAGKSSILLAAALSSPVRTGIISLEDTPDIVGSRALGFLSGVDSLKIRTKDLNDLEKQQIKNTLPKLAKTDILVAYEIGSTLQEIVKAVNLLAEKGCRFIWIDYLQKIRGITEDRRNEVSTAYTSIQRASDRAGVAVMFVSQFSRQPDPTRTPQIHWLKESGDLENEARLIVLAHRDPQDDRRLICRVAKATFGGEGLLFSYRRDEAGALKEFDPYAPMVGTKTATAREEF